MQTHRLLNTFGLAFALVLILSAIGCQSQPDQSELIQQLIAENAILAERNTDLDAKKFMLTLSLATQEGEEKARIAYQESQAGLAAGCSYVISMCPDSITAVGRRAQFAGYGGGTSNVFWQWVIAKFFAAGIFFGTSVCVALLWWIRLVKPEAAAVELAQTIVERVEAQANIAHTRSTIFEDAAFQAQNRAKVTEQSNHLAQLALDALEAEIEIALDKLHEINLNYNAKLQMTAALDDAF